MAPHGRFYEMADARGFLLWQVEPYHAYYALRRAFAPVLLSFEIDTFIRLWAINDSTEEVTGTVKIQLYHLRRCEFQKEILREETVPPGKSKVVVRLDQAGIRAFRRDNMLCATMSDKLGVVLALANAFADMERRLTFPEAALDVKVDNGLLVITTYKFALAVHLEGDAAGDALGWFFEENYFDLLRRDQNRAPPRLAFEGENPRQAVVFSPRHSRGLEPLQVNHFHRQQYQGKMHVKMQVIHETKYRE